MVIVLTGMAAAVIAIQRLWKTLTRSDPTMSSQTTSRVKLGTGLLIVLAQAVGYVVELLSGARSSPPPTKPPGETAEGAPRVGINPAFRQTASATG